MALHNLTPADSWDTPQSVTAGDKATAADMDSVLQDAANRTNYLYMRGVTANTNVGDASEPWDGTTAYGAAYQSVNWGVLAGLTYSLAGDNLKAGTVVEVTAVFNGELADASDKIQFRLARVDNGGAAAMIEPSGGYAAGVTPKTIVLTGTTAIAADLASCVIRVEAKCADASDIWQTRTPSNMSVLVTRKFAP